MLTPTDIHYVVGLLSKVAAQPYPLLFATISGAHLYGFPSPELPFGLPQRGCAI
jgi:hypothetical protein